MKIKKIFIIFVIFITTATNAFATQLPKQVNDFIFANTKGSNVRFDGLVTFSDGTMYLPIFPSYPQQVEKLKITYTYPSKMPFSKKPEVIIFNSNFALLKVVKTKNGIITVCQNPDIPMSVKTGSLPQDILVPKGLVLPDSLKGILGDVQIPLLNSSAVVQDEPAQNAPLPAKMVPTRNLNANLKNKIFLVNNYDSQYLKVFSSDIPEPMYSLKLSGVYRDMIPVCNQKFLLVLSYNKKFIDVVDIKNEYIAKQIDLPSVPTEIISDNKGEKAYIASESDKSIFVLDLKEMKIKEKIQVVGTPIDLAISNDDTQIAYHDRSTSNIYILSLDGTYENKLISNVPNLSKMILANNTLFSIARTEQKFNVTSYDLNKDFDSIVDKPKAKKTPMEAFLAGFDEIKAKDKKDDLEEEIKDYAISTSNIEIGQKPTDLLLYKDKIFILCSGTNQIYVYNISQNRIEKVFKLPMAGFARRITRINSSNTAMVTNVLQKKYALIDLDKNATIQTVNINSPINAITVIDKK